MGIACDKALPINNMFNDMHVLFAHVDLKCYADIDTMSCMANRETPLRPEFNFFPRRATRRAVLSSILF